ncbi:MAG TPA: hypothetical protein VK157_15920 [Phycisphaerales bacterium]|nr:hypothetical protein [Phycisphaerales bacterium]
MNDHAASTMFLGTPELDRFSLRVVGYQFPQARRNCPYDRNWLILRGEVQCGDSQWTFEDPCLLTSELTELIAWLQKPPQPGASIWFTEPLLLFEWSESDAGCLLVRLRAEALPDEVCNGRAKFDPGITLNLHVSPTELDRFAATLEGDLMKFPAR